ncbi:MAG: T9SS type A sorting domain-containing protein [Bacteroidales bacterium]|nr:T9SS type A sorting domain-containing protein [Bacteroidales bacterium]
MKKNILIIFLISSISAFSGTFYSILDGMGMGGNWNNGGYWSFSSGGAPCGAVPGERDIIYVETDMTLDVNFRIRESLTIANGASLTTNTYNLEVNAGGTLNSDGLLRVWDLTFYNGSFVNLLTNSTTIVLNDLTNMNNSDDVSIDGAVDVTGDFYNGNGGIIAGTGSISAGTFTGSGTTFGFSPNSSIPPGSEIPFPLPVELISFSALHAEFFGVRLEWTTASEINNSHFIVERSVDGKQFVELTKVMGAGNTSELTHYSAEDTAPENGLAYYRLRQVDYDGTTAFSPIVPFRFESIFSGDMLVFPNPAEKGETINVNFEGLDPNKEVLVIVNDIMGKLKYSKVLFTDLSGSVLEAVDPNNVLSPGTYIIVGTSQDKIYKKKFIIR